MNTTETKPYLITLNRLSNVPPATVFNQQRISGAIVEVSDYFDIITHRPNSIIYNARLQSQLEALIKYDVPFGLYLTLRARNVSEVNVEFNAFFNVAQYIKPQIGIWVKRMFTQSTKTTNDAMIQRSFNILSARKYENQIGLYLSNNDLNNITWSMHKDRWLLWIDNHIRNNIELVNLVEHDIVPQQFFEVDNVNRTV